MRSREYDFAGAASASHSLKAFTSRAYWTIRGEFSLHIYFETCLCQSRQGKRTFQESWEENYFCCAQDDNVRCLLCSIVQKGTHKWIIKRHYDTVLCSKSNTDAANRSIFTLRHVHCGLRCATSLWGHIEYMIADAWRRELTESAGDWLLWREYWKVGTMLQEMSTPERLLCREVAARCG